MMFKTKEKHKGRKLLLTLLGMLCIVCVSLLGNIRGIHPLTSHDQV